MGGVFAKADSPRKVSIGETKLEAKMVEAVRKKALQGNNMKSFNSIILKFPKIDQSFRKCKDIFEQFDKDSNGTIDVEELRSCFHEMQIAFTDDEISEFFVACDINENIGMKFNEFIVLLCLVYLLKQDPTTVSVISTKSRMGMPELEATFETLINAFVMLDRNRDGYVTKAEMIEALDETHSGELSSGPLAMKRFEEMDWDNNGKVNFKEFLFAFTRWVGMEDLEDEEGDEQV